MLRILSILFVAVLLLAACGKKAEEKTEVSYLDDEKIFTAASNKLVAKFGGELKGELISAMSEGGAIAAIEVCHEEAPKIAAANSGEYWSIRRVSDRSRNPDNLASTHELDVMASLQDTIAPSWSHEWADTETKPLFRFYQTIRIAPVCTKCHGTEDAIDADVKAMLAELYPDDKAVGYQPGDLRGMFVVEVQWPEGRAFADGLVGDTL